MTYPSRSIHSGAPAPHRITHPVLRLRLLLLSTAAAAAPNSATAQRSINSSSSPESSPSSINSSITVVVVVLFLAFFFMCFLTLSIRYCNPEDESENSRHAAAIAAAQRRLSKPSLDPGVIDSFPIFQYSDVKHLKIGKGGTLECAVCIAEFENDDALRLLPKCDHVFHPECIDAWLASHSTCPVCRADLTPSPNELGQRTESAQSNNSDGAGNQNQGESQNGEQIQIQVSEFPRRKLPRSHSTGHSLSRPGEDLERYTLRLPVELRSQSLQRTISCVVVFPAEGSSRRGVGGGEGSSRGRSDRWVFSMTPPFLSRARIVALSPKEGFEGDLTAVGVGVGGPCNRSFFTNVRTPFDCLAAVKSDGVGQMSTRPPV